MQEFIVSLEFFSAWLLLSLGAIYVLFLVFLYRGLGRLRLGNSLRTPPPSVSILLCARNEESSIATCLQDLLSQDYAGEWEIRVADDRSTDSTPRLLEALRTAHPDRLHILRIDEVPANSSPKKNALEQLVAECRGEILLLTDADCRIPPTWATGMVREFEPGIRLVAGHSYISTDSHSPFILGIQALESMSYRVAGSAALAIGLPLTSTGTNLAYRKELFVSSGGFSGVSHLLSGDDDLLLHRLASHSPWAAKACVAPETFIETQGHTTWRGLWEQRKRWASPTVYYHWRAVVALSLIFAFYAWLPVCLVLGLVSGNTLLWAMALGCFVLKAIADSVVMEKGLRLFGAKRLLRYLPVAELLHIPAIVGATLAGVFGNPRWKN